MEQLVDFSSIFTRIVERRRFTAAATTGRIRIDNWTVESRESRCEWPMSRCIAMASEYNGTISWDQCGLPFGYPANVRRDYGRRWFLCHLSYVRHPAHPETTISRYKLFRLMRRDARRVNAWRRAILVVSRNWLGNFTGSWLGLGPPPPAIVIVQC